MMFVTRNRVNCFLPPEEKQAISSFRWKAIMKIHNLGSTVQYDNPVWNGCGFVEEKPNELWAKLPETLKNIAVEEIKNGNSPISILENKDQNIVLLSFKRGPLIQRNESKAIRIHTEHQYCNYCYDGTSATLEDVESGCFLSFEDPEYDENAF